MPPPHLSFCLLSHCCSLSSSLPISQVCRGLVREAPTSPSTTASRAAHLLRTLAETPSADKFFPGNWQVISDELSAQGPKTPQRSCVPSLDPCPVPPGWKQLTEPAWIWGGQSTYLVLPRAKIQFSGQCRSPGTSLSRPGTDCPHALGSANKSSLASTVHHSPTSHRLYMAEKWNDESAPVE